MENMLCLKSGLPKEGQCLQKLRAAFLFEHFQNNYEVNGQWWWELKHGYQRVSQMSVSPCSSKQFLDPRKQASSQLLNMLIPTSLLLFIFYINSFSLISHQSFPSIPEMLFWPSLQGTALILTPPRSFELMFHPSLSSQLLWTVLPF